SNRRGGRAADRTGLENRRRREASVGSNPTPSAVQFDAGWCRLVRITPFFPEFPSSSLPLASLFSWLFAVQFGAGSEAPDARWMAPLSAPLGTTVGTSFEPSVPVARNAPATVSTPSSEGIGGSDARADAWSW